LKIDKKVLRRVVRVLLNKLPKDEETLLKVADDLDLLQTLYKKDKNFRNLLLNPKLEVEKKLQFIDELASKANLNDVVVEAVKYLVKINKANILKVLANEFKFEVERFFATVKGEIITAYPLSDEDISEIKDVVEKKIGKKVEFDVKEDPSIIGGVVVKAGSYILDASVKSFLRKLAYQLTSV